MERDTWGLLVVASSGDDLVERDGENCTAGEDPADARGEMKTGRLEVERL
jgi:hypothetical protein